MKRNKLFLILVIITAAMVFAIAAICNQCSILPAQETKDDVEKGTDTASADTTAKETTGATASKTKAEEPTIELKVYMGPEYNAADDVCYYRIEANVKGDPFPEISWSKDDSNGTWGENIAQVNLNNSDETYTLTATATNSEGTASDSVELTWECEQPSGKGGGDDDEEGIDFEPPEWTGHEIMGTGIIYYDFTEQAPSALWKADLWYYGEPPPGLMLVEFGDDTNTRYGAAFYRYHGILENGTGQPRVLETHPYMSPSSNGFICGIYQNILVPPDAYFEAEIGYLESVYPDNGGVIFALYFDVPPSGRTYSYFCEWKELWSYQKEYNGHLGKIAYSLEDLEGETGSFIFLVHRGTDNADSFAVWVDPVIVIR